MKQPHKKQIQADKLAVWVCTLVLMLMGGFLLALFFWTGCYLLLTTALVQWMGAAAQLILLLPVCDAPVRPVVEETPETPDEEGKKRRKRKKPHWAMLRYRLLDFYHRSRSGLVAVLIAVVTIALHVVFWNTQPGQTEKLGYHIPVLLAVLFVVSVVLEKWCAHVMPEARSYTKAQLNGLLSVFMMGRIAYVLAATTAVLKLLGVYDAQLIVRIALSVLFVYETVLLGFSLVVRLVRKEMSTYPELIVSVRGMGKDMNILTYLEENTGITMRSLWSLQLIKQILPATLLGLVLVVWLSSGVVQVEAYQQGAMYRFGKLQTQVLQPGLHLTLPWPFDRVEVWDTKVVKQMAIGYVPEGKQDNVWTEAHGGTEYNLLLGGGDEIVAINLLVEYRIDDLVEYLKNSSAPEQLLQARAYEIITAKTISTDVNTLLAADREVFAETFRQDLVAQLETCNTGLEIVNVVLESVHPPVDIAWVYQEIISAGIEAQYTLIDAENSANMLIFTANEENVKTIGAAEEDKHKKIADAQAAVTEFMAAVAANEAYPEEYRYYKYLTALSKAYGGGKLVIVGEGIDTGSLYIGSATGDIVVNNATTGNTYTNNTYEDVYEENDQC